MGSASRHVLRVVVGYAGAVLVAALVAMIGLRMTFGRASLAQPSDLPAMLAWFSAIIAVLGLPGWLAGLALAAGLGRRGPLAFALLGGLAAVPGGLLMVGMRPPVSADLAIAAAITLASGGAGGLAWWTLAGPARGG